MIKAEKILSFSPYAYWRLHALYEVAICHNLKWRGHDYTYVSCDGLFSDCDMFWESTVGPRPANACAECQSEVKSLLEGCRIPNTWLGKYRTAEDERSAQTFAQKLKDSELLDAVFGQYPVGAWVKSSIHSHLRINAIDLSNPKHCATLRSYLYSGALAITCIARMLDAEQPTIMLLFNGRMSVTRIAFELARKRGIRVVCHERGMIKETLQLWENENCLSLRPYAKFGSEWAGVPLGAREVPTVTQWLMDRAHGTNLNWKTFSTQCSLGQLEPFLARHQGKQLWTLCTSSMDELVCDENFFSVFHTQNRWVEETIDFVRRHPVIALVIRVHPNSGGKKSTGTNRDELNFFGNLKNALPDNAALVMPDDEISTYGLIDRTDLGLVYCSTVALEMACRGIKVLLGARSPWEYCEAMEYLTEPSAYQSILEKYAATPRTRAETERIAAAAYRFAYAYIFRWNIPFPLVRMPDVHHGELTAKTLEELKPGVHDCLDYCAEIVLGIRPSIPVVTAPVKKGAHQEEIEALRIGLKTLSGEPPVASAIRVSVIIPCYNYGRYLRDCVRSVARQTFQEFEIIIVNDGSTDNSLAVAKACAAEFSDLEIKIIDQPNAGQPAISRNNGIALARGEFILALDADDQIGPDFLKQAFSVIDTSSSGIDIVCANALFVKNGEKTLARPGRFDLKTLSAANQLVYCCMYRRKLWEEIGGYRTNVRGYEDWDFWLAACLKTARLGYVQCTGLIYNQKDQGVYSETVSHHQARVAQITLNNRGAYTAEQITHAEKLLGTTNPLQERPAVGVHKGRRIIALMSAYNEGDIISHVIGDLIENGLSVYLIDNHSTDNTVAEASRWLGKGLLKIEKFPGDVAGYSARGSKEYVWREILRRKEELSGQLEAAWFLHVDADEFRESPWPGMTLADAIRKVEALGYNAINFDLYNFRPTDDGFVPGNDVRQHITRYQPGELFDAVQIKAWKNPGVPAQLVNNGGHSVAIPQRRVCPINFILRHYPIRGETHGRRKVYQDRLPRFAKEEVAINWHVQYNAFVDGSEKFLHKPEALVAFDGAQERAKLLARFSEDILLTQTMSGGSSMTHGLNQEAAFAWVTRRLAMPEPLAPELGVQAEQVLVNFLTALEKKQEIPVEEVDDQLARLLLALLEMKLAFARLEGNSHLACLALRLDALLRTRVSAPPIPDSVAGPDEVLPESVGATPLVSVCIPTFNGATFIAETLASALAQTYSAIEVIVSDDSSTDGTLEIVEKVAKDSRVPVRVLHHTPNGMVANWENCIANSRGRYVKFLFQDDLLMPDCVEQLVAVAQREPGIGLVFSRRKIEKRDDGKPSEALNVAYRDGIDLHEGWTKLAAIQPGFVLLNDSQLLGNPINKIGEPTTVLLSKAALSAVGGFDPALKQLVDVDLWLRIMTRYQVGFCDKELSCFRLHSKQATQANRQAGAINDDWKRFYGKLAQHAAFACLPEMHRTHAWQMFLQLGGSAPVGEATIAGKTDATAFQQALEHAESLLKEGRTAEAVVQMEAVVKLAPTPEGLKSAEEILAALKEQNQQTGLQAAEVEVTPPPGNVDFFGGDEVQNIEQLLATYAANPAEEASRTPVESLQQNLMQFLVTNQAEEIERLFKGNFAKVYRLLAGSGFVAEPPTESSTAQLSVLDDALAAPGDSFDFRPLLARMISAPAYRGSGAVIDVAKIPAWVLEDYLGHLLRAPQILAVKGEAEDYHEHLLRLAKAVMQRIQSRPNESLTKTLVSAFALKVNGIPLYATASDLRAFAEKRAAILEFFLKKNGAVLNATLPKRPKDRKKIKVGFLSAHFGAQTETHVTLPALQLDKNQFEVCLFAVSRNPGPIEERCRNFADSFTLLPAKLDAQVAAIRSAALDVVIIGTNITAVTNQVVLIAAHRLAPLQLATYCSPSTTGLRQIDGYLSGTLNKVPGVQEQFTEKLYFLEGAPGCLDYTIDASATRAPLTRADLGLGAEDVVFVNAASCYKIVPEMLETWAEILKSAPSSRLLLLPFNPNWATNFPAKQFERILVETLACHGVDRERVTLAGPQSTRADVKAIEQLADIYLDTAPFSGSISLVDALEVGLPTLVWEGSSHRSRAGASLIRSIGLAEMIVGDRAAYIHQAVSLASDRALRTSVREKTLREMGQRPGFVNPSLYASHLAALLERLVSGKKQTLASA